MGRKMVMVAGLLTNSVTMDTRTHASRVTAHDGRLLRHSICCPIHVERPELCRKMCSGKRSGGFLDFQGSEVLAGKDHLGSSSLSLD